MGIVVVAALAAWAPKMVPGVAMTATRRRTMSAITDDTRSNRPSNQLYSTVTFWPSTQPPASLRPLRNALARRTEASADLRLTRATTGNGGCCARAARGHVMVEQATTLT